MKNIKNISIRFAAAFASCAMLAGVAGCNEDKFLDISSPDEISTADFPTTLDHATSLVTSAYGQLNCWNLYGSAIGGYIMYPLEYDVDWEWRDGQDWIATTAGTNEAPTDRVTIAWTDLNKGVHYANVAIEGLKVYMSKAQESDQATLKNLLGETLFLRAFYWWHLQNIYGSPDLAGQGIPILKHSTSSYEDAQTPRSTAEESYKAIAETLEEAIPYLEGQTNKYRVDKWAAIGLLAKTYFFLHDNASAKVWCEKIINESGKSLVSYSWLRNMYNGDVAYEHPSESLFEIENVLGASAYQYNAFYKPGTEFSRWDTHCSLDPTGKRKSMDNANMYCHDRNLARFGYSLKAPGNYIHASETLPRDGYIPFNAASYPGFYLEYSNYIKKEEDMKTRALQGKAAAGDPDPRFFVSVMLPFVDSCKASGGVDWAPISQNIKTASGNNLWWETAQAGADRNVDYAFPIRKYKFLGGVLSSDGKNCSGENNYFMRLPEIYLIYAQILKDEGNTAQALEMVNKVHRRAYGQNPNSVSSYDYKSLTDRTKTVDASDQLANDPLKYELWAETFAEMVWWSYIRYYKIGSGEAGYYKMVHGAGNEGITNCVFPDRHYIQPVPVSELERNKNLTQAEDYIN
jgi:SusD family.